MLRRAGADALAVEVERQGGVDEGVLAEREAEVIGTDCRIRPGSQPMIDEGRAWMTCGKEIHPRSDTVDD